MERFGANFGPSMIDILQILQCVTRCVSPRVDQVRHHFLGKQTEQDFELTLRYGS